MLTIKQCIQEQHVEQGSNTVEVMCSSDIPVASIIKDVNRALKELAVDKKYKLSVLNGVAFIELYKDENE